MKGKLICLGMLLTTLSAALYAQEGGSEQPKGDDAQPSFTTKYILDPINNNKLTAGIAAATLATAIAYKTVPGVKKQVDKGAAWLKARGQEGYAVIDDAMVKPVEKIFKKLDRQKLSRADALALLIAGGVVTGIYHDVLGVRTKTVSLLDTCKEWLKNKTGDKATAVFEWVSNHKILSAGIGAGALAGLAYVAHRVNQARAEKAEKERSNKA